MNGQFTFQNLIVHITLKNIQTIQASGATHVEGISTFQINSLIIQFSGNSKVSLDINSKSVISSQKSPI